MPFDLNYTWARPPFGHAPNVAQEEETINNARYLPTFQPTCSLNSTTIIWLNLLHSQEVHKGTDLAIELPCKHFFHPECVVPWLKLSNTCPLCRNAIPLPAPTLEEPDVTGAMGRAARLREMREAREGEEEAYLAQIREHLIQR